MEDTNDTLLLILHVAVTGHALGHAVTMVNGVPKEDTDAPL